MKKERSNIIRISFSNHFSFKDENHILFSEETRFSSQKEFWNLIETKEDEDKVLPVSIFYGANASGKSKLLSLFLKMKQFLNNSEKNLSKLSAYVPFILDEESKSKDSLLEFEFFLDKKIIIYKLIFNKQIIKTETLTSNNKILYNRENGNIVYEDSDISNYDKDYIKDTISKRQDVLVLELLTKRNIIPYTRIHKFFNKCFIFCNEFQIPDNRLVELYNNKREINKISQWLNSIDLGISRFEIEQIKIDEETQSLNKELFDIFNKKITAKFKSVQIENFEPPKYDYQLKYYHIGKDGNEYPLSNNQESDGTLAFLSKIIMFYPAFINGGIFICDEIERSLHPILVKRLVQAFNNPKINKGGAQLICTTHDVNLLKSDILRRDEIWFIEKDISGVSTVYPLSSFKDIRNNYDYESGYLKGRFGAIPFLGDIRELEKLMDE
ncbi:ATP-binding protein [bacterium]|nr:ATP-binding protein [bacterium]